MVPHLHGGAVTLPSRSALAILAAGPERQRRDPLAHVRLTVPQRRVFEEPAKMAAWVDGNQLGKSFLLAYFVHRFIRGETPQKRRYPDRPAKVLVIGESYEQMVPLMEKLWVLSDQRELRANAGYEPGRGITGKPPRLVWEDGPAAGAEIHFATYRSGQRRIAGGTYDLVVCDEPPPEAVIGELMPRLLRLDGYLRIGFTPVPDMYPQEYLIQYFEKGEIVRHTYGLEIGNVWAEGYPAPFLSQRQIDKYVSTLLPGHVAMRTRGSLDPVVTQRWVPSYDDQAHHRAIPLEEVSGQWRIVVATDHGTVAGKQCSVVAAVRDWDTARPLVRVLGESVSERATTPEEDARAILALLRRLGLDYDHVDDWYGDVPTQLDSGVIRKQNELLAAEIGRILRRTPQRILVPKKHRGSVEIECRALNTIAKRGDLIVASECRGVRAGLLQFDGSPDHKHKDVLDAARYAALQCVTGEIVPGWRSIRYS